MPRRDYSQDPRLEGVARWLYGRILEERKVFNEKWAIEAPAKLSDLPPGEARDSWYREAADILRVVDAGA